MPSRFDIALNKAPENKPEPKKSFASKNRVSRQNFLNHLKLVNEANGKEFRLNTADFSLSIAAAPQEPEATITIRLNCPVREAQKLMAQSSI